jgi:hypothetical protein
MSQTTRRALLLGMVSTAALAGCGRIGESKLNPRNWFRRSRRNRVTLSPEALAEAADGRGVVDQVISATIEPVHGGAILRATGLPPVQGFFDGELVPVVVDGGDPSVLVYVFRIAGPWGEGQVSTQVSREVIVAKFLSLNTLEGVREIRIEGERNSQILNR